MKKVMLLTKSFVVLSLLFCSIGVFADVPKTINVQGKVTNDSGGPITGTTAEVHLYISENGGRYIPFDPVGGNPVKLDSEGLYNVDINLKDMNFYADKEYKFKVEVTADRTTIRSDEKLFASNPFAFYASSATYSLMLDPINGEKLVNGNFKQSTATWNAGNTYKIAVGSATYAKSASAMTKKGSQGQVWTMTSSTDQGWKGLSDLDIPPASNEKIGGIKLDKYTGLSYDISEDNILRVLPATKETIGGVIVATNYGLDIGEDGTLNISPASTGVFGVVKIGDKKGLVLDTNSALGVSVDNSTIEINGTDGKLKVKNDIFQPKLTKGDGINIDNNTITVAKGDKKGLTFNGGNLEVSVDNSTIEINGTDGKLKVKNDVFQPKLTKGDGINMDNDTIAVAKGDKQGLTFDANGNLGVSVDNSTIEINGTDGKLKVKNDAFQPKLTKGNGINMDNDTIAVAKGDKQGLTFDANGNLGVSVDNSTIEINSADGNLKVKNDVFQSKLTKGNGINMDNDTIAVAKGDKQGLTFDANGNLGVSVDNSTIEINSADGNLKVKGLPDEPGVSVNNVVWGYKDSTHQGWVPVGNFGLISAGQGLFLGDNNILRVSTATGTGLVFEGTGTNAVLKISTGTGLAINDSNEIVVPTGAGLTFDADNRIVVSTGTGLTIDTNNKINVVAATDEIIGGFKLTGSDAHDSGLAMGEDAILKVSTGTGLDIDTNNKVVVTTAPYAKEIGNLTKIETPQATSQSTDNAYYYVWGAEANNDTNHTLNASKQGWLKIRYNKQWVDGNRNYILLGVGGADLAEIYQSTEKLVPGDVVSIDPAKDNAIVKTKVAEDTMVAGVISTEPGVLMNQDEKGYKLALVGKVPTKVCNEGGAIKRGDLLVSASIPGYAKKAGDNPKIGTVIGKALENSDSQKGTILVLVNLQ